MKRVEAGEDVFEDLHDIKTEQSTVVWRDDCKNIPATTAMNINNTESIRSCHNEVIETIQAYDALTRRDQGAVLILCEMGKSL